MCESAFSGLVKIMQQNPCRNVQEETQCIINDVKMWRWTPELYDRVKNILPYVDIFNILRNVLLPKEYDQFDMEYCEYFRPGQKELAKYIKKEREKDNWEQRKQEAEQHRMNLLRQKERLLRQNLRQCGKR